MSFCLEVGAFKEFVIVISHCVSVDDAVRLDVAGAEVAFSPVSVGYCAFGR